MEQLCFPHLHESSRCAEKVVTEAVQTGEGTSPSKTSVGKKHKLAKKPHPNPQIFLKLFVLSLSQPEGTEGPG